MTHTGPQQERRVAGAGSGSGAKQGEVLIALITLIVTEEHAVAVVPDTSSHRSDISDIFATKPGGNKLMARVQHLKIEMPCRAGHNKPQ